MVRYRYLTSRQERALEGVWLRLPAVFSLYRMMQVEGSCGALTIEDLSSLSAAILSQGKYPPNIRSNTLNPYMLI